MTLTRYEKTDLIGESHVGQVWRCVDTQTGDYVAALELNQQIGAVAGWENVWQEVLRYYRDFKHEYIVPARDTDESQRHVIMELMRGSMRRLLDAKGTVDAQLVRTCLRRSLETLSVIHAAGMLHGDIRPDQLLYQRDGAIRLSFSIGLKPGGVIIPRTEYNEYFAPELVDTGAGDIGPGIDLYALGITAYELLVGTEKLSELGPAVNSNSPNPQGQWLQWQADPARSLPRLSDVFAKVPKDLSNVIELLTRKSPADRMSSAAEAIQLLDTTGKADDVIVPIAELPDEPYGHDGDPAVQVDGRVSSGWSNAIPPTSPVSSSTEASNPASAYSGTDSFHAAPISPVQTSESPSSGYSPGVSSPFGGSSNTNQKAKKSSGPPSNLAIFGIAAALVLVGFGMFEGYQRFVKPSAASFQLTVLPSDATVLLQDKPIEGTKGVFSVAVKEAELPVTLQVQADGYETESVELKFEKEGTEEAKNVEVRLAPIITTFTVTVVPPEAAVQLDEKAQSLFDDSKSNAAADSESDAPQQLYELRSTQDAGVYEVSIPFPKKITIQCSNEGYSTKALELIGSGKRTATSKLQLDGLKTEYSIRVKPVDASVVVMSDGDPEVLAVEKGLVTYTVPWGDAVSLEISSEGHESQTEVLNGTESEKQPLSINLNRSPTTYSIVVKPATAKLTLGGRPLEVVNGMATAVVPFNASPELAAGKEYYESFEEVLSWDKSLTQTVSIQLVAHSRPLSLSISPASVDATVRLNSEEGPTVDRENGQTVVPVDATSLQISSPGFRTQLLTLDGIDYDREHKVTLVSELLPAGLTAVEGCDYDEETWLPLIAEYQIPNSDISMRFLLVDFQEGWKGGITGAYLGTGEQAQWTNTTGQKFYLGATEVTNEQYHALMPGDQVAEKQSFPVANVSWNEAKEYCEALHPSCRLPTEKEWERAARGGRGDIAPVSAANINLFGANGEIDALDASTVAVSEDGVNFNHMLGNVSEWCADDYELGFGESWTDATLRDRKGTLKVVRGGSFLTVFALSPKTSKRLTRFTWRLPKSTNVKFEDVGFRPLLEIGNQ